MATLLSPTGLTTPTPVLISAEDVSVVSTAYGVCLGIRTNTGDENTSGHYCITGQNAADTPITGSCYVSRPEGETITRVRAWSMVAPNDCSDGYFLDLATDQTILIAGGTTTTPPEGNATTTASLEMSAQYNLIGLSIALLLVAFWYGFRLSR